MVAFWPMSLLLTAAVVAGLRVDESETLRSEHMSLGLERVKRQVVFDPHPQWFNGPKAEVVAPGGVHTQTQVESMRCLGQFMEYLTKQRIKPRGEHDAILNNHLFESAKDTAAICFGYNRMERCVHSAGRRGQRNGEKLIQEHPLFTIVRGADWLCGKPHRRYRQLDKHRKCFTRSRRSVLATCDRRCKVPDRAFKGVAGLARDEASMERRIKTESQFRRELAGEQKQLSLLCSKAKCLLACERAIVRRNCPKDLRAPLFKLRFYKDNLFSAKAEGDSRLIWDGVNFNGFWPPACQDIQSMSVF